MESDSVARLASRKLTRAEYLDRTEVITASFGRADVSLSRRYSKGGIYANDGSILQSLPDFYVT